MRLVRCLSQHCLVALLLLGLGFSACIPRYSGPRHTGSFRVEEATIDEVLDALAKGATTCREILHQYLDRIDRYDREGPRLNAFIQVAPDALEQASLLDAHYRKEGPVGPLHCIPVVLKDNIETHNMETTAGSLLLAGFPTPRDAFLVERLREAGALVMAKGNLDEWAHGGAGGYSSAGGRTRNPYGPSFPPGSSSGGPAVAVAANLVMFGIGTDTQGSIRGPVRVNRLAGVKPTHARVSRSGIVPFAPSLDVAGPMTRTVRDAAIILDVITGRDPEDPATAGLCAAEVLDHTRYLVPDALAGARIGVLRDYLPASVAVELAVEELRTLGAEIIDHLEVPVSIRHLSAQYYGIISQTEMRNHIGPYLQLRRPEVGMRSHDDLVTRSEQEGFTIAPEVLLRLRAERERGNLDDPDYRAALGHALDGMREGIDSLLDRHDLDALLNGIGGTALASLSGYPAVLVHAGVDEDEEPQMLEFLGPACGEPLLLGYAFAFEQATRHRKPPDLDRYPDSATAPGSPPLKSGTEAGHMQQGRSAVLRWVLGRPDTRALPCSLGGAARDEGSERL